MKKFIKIGVIISCVLIANISCLLIADNSNAQVVIRGYIFDSLQNKITLLEPINGFCNRQIGRPEWEIKTDKSGYFQRTVNLSKANMLTLFIGLNPVWIFAEPNDTIDITINIARFTNNSPNDGITFKGNNSKGNEYFNSFNFLPGKKLADFTFIVNDSLEFHQTRDFKAIEIGLASATAHFDLLLKNKQITKTFYNLVVPGIKQSLLNTEIRYLLDEQKNIPPKKAIEFASEVYKKYPVTNDIIRYSIFGDVIASYYYETKAKENGLLNFTDSAIFINGKKIVINSNFIRWLYAPREIQEMIWPLRLISFKKLFSEEYDSRDVDAFLTLHPDSPMKEYLAPPYFEDYIVSNNPDTIAFKQIRDTISMKFTDFIKRNLEGKKLFVDFWATWCVPCKQEFKYNNEVDSFCNKYNITKLYVSIDQPETRNSLSKNISAYNLKGYHTILTDSLFSDIKERFYPGKQEVYIPRYLLINEDGKVVNSEAPRPSSGNELFNVMRRDFNISN